MLLPLMRTVERRPEYILKITRLEGHCYRNTCFIYVDVAAVDSNISISRNIKARSIVYVYSNAYIAQTLYVEIYSFKP